jgi:hypothetical protein
LGRSLWFVEGGDPGRIQDRINAFPALRQSDLWSGIGLAATYAGGVDSEVLEEIVHGVDHYRPVVAQGAAFAAKARKLAGIPCEETEKACRVFCDVSADDAAQWTDDILAALPQSDDPQCPPYELWRRGLEERFKDRTLSNVSARREK